MTDDKTGEVTNSGVTIFAYDKTNLDPCEKQRGSFTAKGRKPSKFTVPMELQEKLKQVPGVYDIEVEMQSNKDMKSELTLVDLDFVGTLETKVIKPVAQAGK